MEETLDRIGRPLDELVEVQSGLTAIRLKNTRAYIEVEAVSSAKLSNLSVLPLIMLSYMYLA